MSVKGMVVVMTFSVMAWKSLGLNWTTEALHTNCCEGQDTILMWNCSLEKHETVQDIQWYFNHLTQIAYESKSVKFYVSSLYKDRVEQIGKMGILLKNVSSVDTGNYSLYLNLGPESPEIMQTICLTVFESPTCQCKPSITKNRDNVLVCSINSCGGIQLSTEWRISGKHYFVSKESYLEINSSWNAELVFCCLHRQCQNCNLLDFCTSTFIFFAEDKHAPDCKYTENCTILTGVLAPTCFIFVVICFSYRKKIYKLCPKRCKDKHQHNMEPEDHSMMREMLPMRYPNVEHRPNIELEDVSFRREMLPMRYPNVEHRPNIELEDASLRREMLPMWYPNMEHRPNIELEDVSLRRGRTSDTPLSISVSKSDSHRGEGRTSKTLSIHVSENDSHQSEGRTSKTLSIHVSENDSHQSEGRTSKTWSIYVSGSDSHLSEGRTSEPSLSIQDSESDSHRGEDAIQRNNTNMEREPNMETEDRPMMRGRSSDAET